MDKKLPETYPAVHISYKPGQRSGDALALTLFTLFNRLLSRLFHRLFLAAHILKEWLLLREFLSGWDKNGV